MRTELPTNQSGASLRPSPTGQTTITPTPPFQHSPLITPERIDADQIEALSLTPLRITVEHVYRAGEVIVTVDGLDYKSSFETAALLFELMRVGLCPDENSNGNANPKSYLKLIPPGALEDTVVFLRVIAGAGRGEGVTPDLRHRDHVPENIVFVRSGKAIRDARTVALRNAERLANEGVASCRLSASFDVLAYMANLRALLARIDSAMGRAG